MALPNSAEVFRRMIDDLESAASCSRQLAFLREQNEWLAVDKLILEIRRKVILIAEAKERGNMQRGIYIP